MLEIACYAIALTAAAWALWVRRGTCSIPWEAPITRTIRRLAISLVLIAPAAEPVIGRLFWEVFGKWHLNDLLGHIAALGAMAGSTFAGMMRMPAMRQRLESLLYYPFVLGVAALVFLFWPSMATRSPANDMFHLDARELPGYPWSFAYLALLFTLLLYYAGLNLSVALAHLRGDPRARPVALTWVACLGVGAIGTACWLLPLSGVTAWYDFGRIGMCVCVVAYSVSSARSWQRKLDQWRDLLKATGTRL
jgi:hypothetical protein